MELRSNYTLQNGKYRIVEKIGRGGFGITYRAMWHTTVSGPMGDMQTSIPVAIKEFFFAEYCAREPGASHVTITSVTGREIFERFKNKLKKEGQLLSKLRHPNIVRVLDVFEENNTAYMVMAFVEGVSLNEKLRREGRLSEASVLKYATQLCSALADIHKNRILHLDIKPGNVLIDYADNVQLIDFGISKQYDSTHHETSTTPVGISKGYAPPEQYSEMKEFQPTADIYSLGATLWHALTGKVPPESILLFDNGLPPIGSYALGVSAHVEAAIVRAMSIRRVDRPQSIVQFFNELTGRERPFTSEQNHGTRETQLNPTVMKSTSGHAKTPPPPPPPPTSTPTRISIPPPLKTPNTIVGGKKRTWLWSVVGVAVVLVGAMIFLISQGIAEKHAIRDRQHQEFVADSLRNVFVADSLEQVRQSKAKKQKMIAGTKRQRQRQAETSRVRQIEPEMIAVKGGTFTMGSSSGDNDEKPVHSVTVSDFKIGKYEVTQAQWRAVMGSNPSSFKGDNLPVESVSWDDCQEFIRKLNAATGKNYRLPTEAEWEYAARGGGRSNGYEYSGSNTLGDVAWYDSNSGNETHPVGRKQPNELGIYDMSGNVWEWCSDWYGSYSSGSQTNPKGAASGSNRVFRGGSWNLNATNCRVAYRNFNSPGFRSLILGFRLVLP